MRHQQKGFKLGRTAAHRKATLSALSTALIRHKRITTTHAKAKALRLYIEPIINRAKDDTTHNRRQAFRRLQDKHAVTELFGDVASRIGERPGGYTRIVKIGQRGGDAAPMAIIELVDYNDVKPEGAAGTKRKTRRSRGRRGGGAKAGAAVAETAATATAVDEADVDEADVDEAEVDEAEAEIDGEESGDDVDATGDNPEAAADEPEEDDEEKA